MNVPCHICDMSRSEWILTTLPYLFDLTPHMWDIPYPYVGHDLFIHGTYMIHIWDLAHSYAGRDSHTWDSMHSYAENDSFICVPRLIHTWDLTHSKCVPRFIDTWDMTHLDAWHHSLTRGTWLIHVYDDLPVCVTGMTRKVWWAFSKRSNRTPSRRLLLTRGLLGGLVSHIYTYIHIFVYIREYTYRLIYIYI